MDRTHDVLEGSYYNPYVYAFADEPTLAAIERHRRVTGHKGGCAIIRGKRPRREVAAAA